MTSFFRRAGAQIARFLSSTADPATVATEASLYQKLDTSVAQIFAKTGDGIVAMLTPVSILCKYAYYYCDDFVSSTVSNSVVGGTGANNYGVGAVQGAPGVVRQSVTTSATPDRAGLTPATSTVSALIAGGGAPIYWEGRCNTTTAQDATDQWVDRWGMGDSNAAADQTDGLYFESDRATNGDNNVRLCAANNGARTKTSMGVAPTAGTYERWKLVCNGAGTSVQGYLNDVTTGAAVVTNIPTGAGRFFGSWIVVMVKTAGLVNSRSIDRDYVENYQLFNTPR